MSAKLEFAEMELRWVRQVRKSRNPDLLHLVEPAVQRERELLELIETASRPSLHLMAAEDTPPYRATEGQS
jgi:hypothetical protein